MKFKQTGKYSWTSSTQCLAHPWINFSLSCTKCCQLESQTEWNYVPLISRNSKPFKSLFTAWLHILSQLVFSSSRKQGLPQRVIIFQVMVATLALIGPHMQLSLSAYSLCGETSNHQPPLKFFSSNSFNNSCVDFFHRNSEKTAKLISAPSETPP